MSKKMSDGISGVVILLFAILMYSSLPGPGETVVAGLDMSLAPRLVALILGGLSLMLLAMTFLPYKGLGTSTGDDEEEVPQHRFAYPGRLIATAVLIIAAAALFEWLGFVLTSVIYIFAQCYILTYDPGTFRIVRTAVIAVAFPVAVYLMFWHWLSMPLPKGIL
ncbi:tripartite tricarboxylate transporter TctB family protein [Nitratireductor basaltis]|uniref:Tripartite tricarboxylate transporter TctB family protein n=1 Tax=Nitratireductor basaltis TaxID=472175 RepID=A0A084U8Q3_9HYPH|nr:tripartite tricarboxylate transporter TctB family protein [Nitratireductor basaltis]KFB09339.1 Tripartite tricarboxylate transporter TctB family protein [Nitratireductor basaltis]